MIKKAKKSVAVGLSVALAVTSVNIPTNSASAAAKKAKLSATKKTITAGKSSTLTLKTNKKKSTVIKSIVTKYVKVSTSKSSVATVKKVTKTTKVKGKKVTKVTGIKVTAKKAGKATITVKVTKGTYKGTYKCAVTVKAKPKATTTPTEEPTEEPTQEPTQEPTEEPTQEPTVEPATTPAITEPATTPAITEEPTATPEDVKATVVKSSNITKADDKFTVTLTLDKATYTKEQLKDSKIKLDGKVSTTATFSNVDADGNAVFVVDDAKVLTPGDTTANGDYKVTSASDVLVIGDGIVASYEESLAGNKIKGYVLTDKDANGQIDNKYRTPVAGATVSVEGGQSTTTDINGYYELSSVTGKKILKVSKAGYITKYFTGTNRVYVNKSHVTSQNVALEEFDVKKLIANVKVVNKDSKAAVKDAKVVLKNSAGTELVSATTDANGFVTFANNAAEDGKIVATGAGKIKSDAEANNKLAQGTYTLEVSKKLLDTNVDDVYATFTKTFTIDSDYENNIVAEGTKTAAVKSFKVTQNLKEKAEATYVDTAKIKATYALYTMVDGNSVSAPIIAATDEVTSEELTSTKTVTSDILAKLLAKAGVSALTLPTGDYYLLITPAVNSTASANNLEFAYSAVKVSVTAGGDVLATADLTEGNVRTINSQITLPNKVAGSDIQTAPSDLGVVKWDATDPNNAKFVLAGASTPFNPVTVKASYKISQIVPGTDVAIELPASSAIKEYAKGTNRAYASTTEYKNFLGTGKYKIESTGDYTVAVDPQTEQINNDKGSVNFNVKGAGNAVQLTVNAVEGSAIIGKTAFSKLTKLVVYDATGKAVRTFDYTNSLDPAVAAKQVTGNDDLTQAGDAGKVDPKDKSVYNLLTDVNGSPAKNFIMNLPEGKYTFGITLDGYKEAVTDAVDVNAIEKVDLTLSKKLEKATADATQISGSVRVLNENKIGYVSLTGSTLTNGTAVLLTADKKIAALASLTWDGVNNVYTYSLVDGAVDGTGKNVIAAGTYTLVIRADQAETKATTVTVAANEQKAWDVDLVQGACGQIKAFALDNYNKVLTDWSAVAVAYDEYFVDPRYAANFVDGKLHSVAAYTSPTQGKLPEIASGTARFGAYLTSSDWAAGSYSKTENGVKQDGYYVFDDLPAGTYTVKLGVNVYYPAGMTDNVYQWKAESVTLKDSGDVVKAEYTYNKLGDTTNTVKVPLTINLKAGVAVTPSDTNPFVVIIEPTKGAGTQPYMVIATSAADLQKIEVDAKTNYNVTVFTYEGYQLASNSINVERSAATVEVALNGSEID